MLAVCFLNLATSLPSKLIKRNAYGLSENTNGWKKTNRGEAVGRLTGVNCFCDRGVEHLI